MTCRLCSTRFQGRACPHCTPLRKKHAGKPLADVLHLFTGSPVRPIWDVWAAKDMADEAMRQIRATPPRTGGVR
jgi:hypothetical protein